MTTKRSRIPSKTTGMRVGQPFNPFGFFNGIFVPEALLRARGISLGAKVTFGRLARYAGQAGNCYPSVRTLAAEVATSERQTQRYLGELERKNLIRRMPRILKSGQTSSIYVFLWHPLFEEGATDPASEGVTDLTSEGATDKSPKESQVEESHPEESHNIDLDYRRTNRKNRDLRPDAGAGLSQCKQYPRLRDALADYMTADDGEIVCPPERLVLDVMDAAAGATQDEVIQCLRYLREDRGLRRGTRHGPRSFAWFKSVVADHFIEKHNREMVYSPPAVDWDRRNGPGLSPQEFDSMTSAIEID
jgi:hypothetical protein